MLKEERADLKEQLSDENARLEELIEDAKVQTSYLSVHKGLLYLD